MVFWVRDGWGIVFRFNLLEVLEKEGVEGGIKDKVVLFGGLKEIFILGFVFFCEIY